jgi:hypothetical protein
MAQHFLFKYISNSVSPGAFKDRKTQAIVTFVIMRDIKETPVEISTGNIIIHYMRFRTINLPRFLPYSFPLLYDTSNLKFNAISHEYHSQVFDRKLSPSLHM